MKWLSGARRHVKLNPPFTDEAIHALVQKGAALSFREDPDQRAIGVAWWRRVSANRHFWHTPGFSDFDGHTLDFAREAVIHDGLGVSFFSKDGQLVAYLSTVEEKECDTVAAERVKASIARWKADFDREAHLRAGVLGNYHRQCASP